jgi:hypothetical protein
MGWIVFQQIDTMQTDKTVNNVSKEPAASFFRVEGGGTWYDYFYL